MAKVNGTPLLVCSKKIVNSKNADLDGKYYYKAVILSTLNLNDLAEHIASHGSLYTKDVLLGVLTKLKDCLTELITTNRAVKIDGLGTFYPALKSRVADDLESLSVSDHISSVYVRFKGDQSQDAQMGGAQLRRRIKVSTQTNTQFSTIEDDPEEDVTPGGDGEGGNDNP